MSYWKLEYDNCWQIICEICGLSFNRLHSHLAFHKITEDDYKKEFWLKKTISLVVKNNL
jgi:predicted transcriptional regulator